jgi:lysozyme family protein
MADLDIGFANTMRSEDPKLTGKVTPDPTKLDKNAVARFGVNSAAHPKAKADGFFTMDRDAAYQYARTVFQYEYFNRIGGYQITDQGIANKYVDIAFEAGISEATEIVQRAYNKLPLPEGNIGLAEDGKCGQRTIDAINKSMPSALLAQIRIEAVKFYSAWAFDQKIPDKEFQSILARVNA